MKKVRSSQPFISMNFCTEFSKTQAFPCQGAGFSIMMPILEEKNAYDNLN